MTSSQRNSATSRPRRSPPSLCTPASACAVSRWRGPALRICLSALPGRVSMSSVDLVDAGRAPVATAGGQQSAELVRTTLRFFTNELRTTFFRRRNQLLLLVAALFPLLIGIVLKLSAPHGGGGGRRAGASGGAVL